MSSTKEIKETLITRERVIAPPNRFIDVTDAELLTYFKSAFSAEDNSSLTKLYEMLEGLCTNNFSRLRRNLERDFNYFANAAEATTGSDPRAKDPSTYKTELDAQETRFLDNLQELLDAGKYNMLTNVEWDAAQAEEFLLTLPVSVNWNSMDSSFLPRAFWVNHADKEDTVPTEIKDRMLIFHRGVDVAHIRGTFLMRKVDLIISFFILQPLYRLFVFIMSMIGLKRFVPEAPTYMAGADEADATLTNDTNARITAVTHRDITSGKFHDATVNIERKTFARTFPDGVSVVKQLFKTIELKEACFKDVIIVYRKYVPTEGVVHGEFDVIKKADPLFLQRNIIMKRFASIPIADLELIFPEKKIYMPPQVFLNMAITVIGGLVAIITAFQGGLSFKIIVPTLTMLGTRAMQVYTTANVQRTTIERAMQNLLYQRTMASQQAVLSSLTEEMSRQWTRELVVTYSILALSPTPLDPSTLDAKCEDFLYRQFNEKIDFTCENAISTLKEWGLIVPAITTTATNTTTTDSAPVDSTTATTTTSITSGALRALPLSEALIKLDDVWDSTYDFNDSSVLKLPGKMFGGVVGGVRKGLVKVASRVGGGESSGGVVSPPGSGDVGKKRRGLFARISGVRK